MSDPIGPTVPGFRADLDGGAVVSLDATSEGVDVLVRLSAARAHVLAHVLADWVGAFGVAVEEGEQPSNSVLGRALDAAATTAGDPGALVCAMRRRGSVPVAQRYAAAAVLLEREPRLSAVQRLAVVDAASRWLAEDAGDELAFALLAAVCSTDVATSQAYMALLAPPATPDATPSARA